MRQLSRQGRLHVPFSKDSWCRSSQLSVLYPFSMTFTPAQSFQYGVAHKRKQNTWITTMNIQIHIQKTIRMVSFWKEKYSKSHRCRLNFMKSWKLSQIFPSSLKIVRRAHTNQLNWPINFARQNSQINCMIVSKAQFIWTIIYRPNHRYDLSFHK